MLDAPIPLPSTNKMDNFETIDFKPRTPWNASIFFTWNREHILQTQLGSIDSLMPIKSTIPAKHIQAKDWLTQVDPPKGSLEGMEFGVNCVLIRYSTDEIGEGPNYHVHPYDELFHILEGRAEFTVGENQFIAEAGSVVIGPANIPHAYKNLGPGRLDSLDVHLNSEWIQYDLPWEGEKLVSRELTKE